MKCNKVFDEHGVADLSSGKERSSHEEVPLSISVRQAIERPVMRQLRVANQCVLLMMFRDYELESRLKELRNVFFFYKADLMNGFLEELAYKNKALSSRAGLSSFKFSSGGVHALNSALREALRRFRPNDSLPFHFEVVNNRDDKLSKSSNLNPFYVRRNECR